MSRLSDLKNLGPASERQFGEVGITTPEEPADVGAVEACLPWDQLPPEVKAEIVEAAREA